MLLRARFLKDVESYGKVQGKPFFRQEIRDRIERILRSRSMVAVGGRS